MHRGMEVQISTPEPTNGELNLGFAPDMESGDATNADTQCCEIDIGGLESQQSAKVALTSLSNGLGECLSDCLCSVIPVDNSNGPTTSTTLDVDEIYQVLGKDILRSSLLEDIGLYLECDEDSLDAIPSKGRRRLVKSPKCELTAAPDSELKFCWTTKVIAATEKHVTTRYICPQCPKSFARESLMSDHRYKVHGCQNLFPCGFCDYQGHCHRLLKKHTRRKHKNRISSPLQLQASFTKKNCDKKSNLTLADRGIAETEQIVTNVIESLSSQPGGSLSLDIPFCPDTPEKNRPQKANISSNTTVIKPKGGVLQKIPIPGTKCFIVTEVVEEGNPPDAKLDVNNCSSLSRIPIDNSELLQSKGVRDNQTKPYSCDACPYACKSSRLLQRHKHALHNAEREVHCCDKCGCMFKQKRSLDTHMKVHGGLFEFHCDFCKKSFASKDHLRLHQRVHIQSRQYVCSFKDCKLAFRTNGHLQQHERNVHGPGIFNCPEPGCDKRFALKRLADAHYKMHTAAYRCFHASCSRTFRDKHNLKVHQKTHRTHVLHDKKASTDPEEHNE